MKYSILMLLFALQTALFAREECASMVADFEATEQAYDAVVKAGVAAPAAEKVIAEFQKTGREIYNTCKDKMSTTRWYMLGKKLKASRVNAEDFKMMSLVELQRYALSNPPVITKYYCGSIITGVQVIPQPR